MLADPVTIAAAAPIPQLVFAKTRVQGYGSEAVDTGGNGFSTLINHTQGKAGNRHYVQVTWVKDATNPYSGIVSKQRASVSMTIARPTFGYTDVDLVDLVELLRDYVFDTEVTPARLIQFQS